jgi:hypothetical protein
LKELLLELEANLGLKGNDLRDEPLDSNAILIEVGNVSAVGLCVLASVEFE